MADLSQCARSGRVLVGVTDAYRSASPSRLVSVSVTFATASLSSRRKKRSWVRGTSPCTGRPGDSVVQLLP